MREPSRSGIVRGGRGVLLLLSMVLVLVAAGAAGCGDATTAGAGVEPSGYWSLTTDEETTLKIVSVEQGRELTGLSADPVMATADEEGVYVSEEATWQGGEASARLRLDEAGNQLTYDVVPAESEDSALTLVFVRASAPTEVLDQRLADQIALWRGQKVEEAIHALQVGVQSWAVDHGNLYPPASAVAMRGEVGLSHLDSWPRNPYTGEPIKQEARPGDFGYERLKNGREYQLTGHLEDGDVTVP